MGTARQPVERCDPFLGDPAARTQQVPAQVEQPGPDRLEAEFDRRALVDSPVAG